MKILCLCDEGNNRSIHLAHPLKYWGNDVLAAGLNNSLDTREMLCEWADLILLTDPAQRSRVNARYSAKVMVCPIGADKYPRPFNPTLARIVKQFLEDNKTLLKHEPSTTAPLPA